MVKEGKGLSSPSGKELLRQLISIWLYGNLDSLWGMIV